MDLIPNYIDRKHGREKVAYPHPMLKEILEPTYGIPVYQEQVMQMAQTMAATPSAARICSDVRWGKSSRRRWTSSASSSSRARRRKA